MGFDDSFAGHHVVRHERDERSGLREHEADLGGEPVAAERGGADALFEEETFDYGGDGYA